MATSMQKRSNKDDQTWWEKVFYHLRQAWLGYVIVSTVFGVIGWIASSTYSQSELVFERLKQASQQYETARTEWVTSSDALISKAALVNDDPRLFSREEALELRIKITALISEVNNLPAPTKAIQTGGQDFRKALSNVLMELSNYDGSPEAFTEVVMANQVASAHGEEHRVAVEKFMGASWRLLLGTLL